ncbi:hypothetical protein ACOMHN_025338 [Nucella lapillus]
MHQSDGTDLLLWEYNPQRVSISMPTTATQQQSARAVRERASVRNVQSCAARTGPGVLQLTTTARQNDTQHMDKMANTETGRKLQSVS